MGFRIPVDVEYFFHPKVDRLKELLNFPAADIYPLRLWSWAAKYAKDGKLPAPQTVERHCGWDHTPGALYSALVTAGFITTDGALHDWMEWAGYDIERYEAKKKYDRQRKSPAKREPFRGEVVVESGRESHLESPSSPVRSGPVRTSPDQTSPSPLEGMGASIQEVLGRAYPTPLQVQDAQAKEAKEPSTNSSSGGPEGYLYERWRAGGVGAPISREKGERLIRFSLDRGAKAAAIDAAFMDAEKCRGRMIWEVLDGVTPTEVGKKSFRDRVAELAREKDRRVSR